MTLRNVSRDPTFHLSCCRCRDVRQQRSTRPQVLVSGTRAPAHCRYSPLLLINILILSSFDIIFCTGSAGTAVDTHREVLSSATSAAAAATAAALHNLSRPKTVRHALTPPRVRTPSPTPLARQDSLSTHASGSSSSRTNAACAAAAVSASTARPPATAAGDGRNKRGNAGGGLRSIEMKGDRCRHRLPPPLLLLLMQRLQQQVTHVVAASQ